MKKTLTLFFVLLALLFPVFSVFAQAEEKPIRWVDFTVTAQALQEAASLDIAAHEAGESLSWTELLACYAAMHGGSFAAYRPGALRSLAEKAETERCPLSDIAQSGGSEKLYLYYCRAYDAVLSGMLGEYRAVTFENGKEVMGEKQYGVCAAAPIAKGYSVTEYNDFGTARSYGYRRRHLGHDMLGSVGTPICAVEGGYVEALGWNQYGGWRIGIRSFDKKRYYYYAHLRQNRPYQVDLTEGKVVNAGDVIGYVGRTGYSTTENVNNINTSHLHFGLELIFDESQKECDNEIWIDLYAITKLLQKHQSETFRVPETKEFYSISSGQAASSKVTASQNSESSASGSS